ncbi:MAG: hypothetical protein EBT92_17735, partial [Planctomycetes bacterium]|nr:hypothetical protein [Planctomycetota bacterium]
GGQFYGRNKLILRGTTYITQNGAYLNNMKNQGTIKLESTSVDISENFTNLPSAIIEIAGTNSQISTSYRVTLNNQGTIKKTGSGNAGIIVDNFNQSNANLVVEGGILTISRSIFPGNADWNNVSFTFSNNAMIENYASTIISGLLSSSGLGSLVVKNNLRGNSLAPAILNFGPNNFVLEGLPNGSSLNPDASTGMTNIGEIQVLADSNTRINSSNFLNTGTIKLQSNSSLSFPNNIRNISTTNSITTLLGGKWIASNGASFVVDNNPFFQIIKADVTLAGTGSFYSLSSAAQNYGSLTFVDKSYGLPSGFENLGTLTVQNTSNQIADLKTLTAGQFINKGFFILGPNTKLNTGTFEQSSVGFTELQIKGSPASGLYGKISSTGTFTENGELAINLLDGFGPTLGYSYPILSYASKTGTFSTVSGLNSGTLALFRFDQGATGSSLVALASATDLKVTAISQTFGSVTANSQQTFTWTVLNNGGLNADSTLRWKDTVYLSSDREIDNEDFVLGTVEHIGGLSTGQTYTQSLVANVPYFAGDMHVLVCTDIQKRIADVNRANNVLSSDLTIYTTLPAITVGAPLSNQILDAQGYKVYKVTLSGNEDVNFSVELGSSGNEGGEIYVRQGAIPFADSGRTDQEFASGVKPGLVIPNASAGTWYVLVRGNANSTFNISARIVPFGIQSVSSSKGANSGKSTILITGSAFDSTTTVQLTSNNSVIAQGTVYLVDRNHISVEFDLTGKPLGTYDIKAIKGGLVSTKAGAFEVVSGNPGRMELETLAPPYIRSNRVVPLTIRYSNPGDTQTEAKLIKVHSDNGKFRLPGSGDNAWSEYGLVLFAYNQDGKPSILPAGSSYEIKLEFMPINNGDHVFSTIVTEDYDDAQTKDYSEIKAKLKPLGVSQTAWNLVADNLQARMGNTIGSWNNIFRQDADYFASIGQRNFQYSDLYSYELRLASNNGSLFTQYKDGALGKAMPDPTKFDIEHLGNDLFAVYLTSENPIFLQFTGYKYSGIYKVGINFRVLGDDSLKAFSNEGYYVDFNGIYTQPNKYLSFYKVQNGTETLINTINISQVFGIDVNNATPRGKIADILSMVSGDNLDSITFSRDTSGRVITIATHQGYTSNYQYNSAGKIISETDFAGTTTTYTYDSTNNHIASITNDAGTSSFNWNTTEGTVLSNLLVSQTDSLGFSRTYTRDSLGRITSEKLSRGFLSRTRDYQYLEPSILKIIEPDGRITINYLGLDGTVVKSISDSGSVLNIATDGNSVTEYLNGSFVTEKTRNYLDNTVLFTNPLRTTFTFSYNDKNFLSSLKEFSGATTQFIYGNNDFLSTTIFPDGSKESFVTNDLEQVTAFTDRSGGTTLLNYDSNGRISQKTYADGTVINYTYDTQDRYNTISSNGQTITYTYSGDNVSKIDYGSGKYVEYQYNTLGLRTRLSTSNGMVQTYTYDDFLRLRAIRDGSGNLQAQYTYNNKNLVSRTDRGNGSYSLYTYNSDNITTRIEHFKSDGTLLTRIDYQVDSFGRITSRTVTEGNNSPQTTHYLYTANNQISLVTLPNGSTTEYVYDANGNRIRTLRNGSLYEQSSFNILNQEVSSPQESFLYDLNGSRIKKTDQNGITDYLYNSLGQLVEVHSGSDVWKYEYDPFGNRKAIIKNGIRTDYIVDPFGSENGLPNVVSQTTGSSTSHFYYGSILESEFDGTNTYSFNYDSVGNTVLVSDNGQNVVNRYQYMPFGEITSSTGTRQNAFQFSGAHGVQNDGNGLAYMRARYYDPSNGVFTQADPIGFRGSPSNLYLYAANNPLRLVDPTGLTPCPPDNHQNGAPPDANFVEQVVYSPEYNVFSENISYANYFASLASFISYGIEKGAFDNINLLKGIRATLRMDKINDTIQALKNERGVQRALGFTRNSDLIKSINAEMGLLGKEKGGLQSLVARFSQAGRAFQNIGKICDSIGKLSSVNDLYSAARDWNKNNAEGVPWYANNNLHNVGANLNNLMGIYGPPPLKAVSALINAADYATNPEGLNAFGGVNNLTGGWLWGTPEQDVLVRRDGFDPDEIDRRKKEKDCAHIEQVNPNDPNDIVGPAGIGPGNSVELTDLSYRIRFENKSNALAPAAEVFVDEVLDTDLDLSTFRFTGAGFGSQSISFDTPLRSVYARVDDRANTGLFVDITGNLDVTTRTVHWVFRSIDPATLQVPADARIGFLPPNTTSPQGEGYLTYTVRPNANSANGTSVTALASIIFDGQQTINTPIYSNTIDTGAPSSTMNALGATQTSTTFTIAWTGTDDPGQSGIEAYDIYVSDNGGPYNIFLADTTNTSTSFTGVNGHTYSFKSIAYDNLGFVQAIPAS